MPLEFVMDPAVRARIAKLGFDRQRLPHERYMCCDLCGWRMFRTISHIDRYGLAGTYQMCEGCGLVFQNPHPTAEGYMEFYAKWYRPLLSALFGRREDAKTIQSSQRSYAERLVQFLKEHVESSVDLAVDLGGSTGIVAKAVEEAFNSRCLVIDPSSAELAEARRLGLECEEVLAEQWNPNGRRFNLVLICRSVDHFLSISAVLSKVASGLRPGGYLFIDAADFEGCARTMSDYRRMLKIDHVFYLSDETMRLYLKAAGFDLVACDLGDYYMGFLARYTGHAEKPACLTAYARETGRMLRERLLQPAPQPYPEDALTRLIRYVRDLPRGGQKRA